MYYLFTCIVCMYVCKQEQYNNEGDTDSSYWEPADSINEIYKQLLSKKYREIVPNQIK